MSAYDRESDREYESNKAQAEAQVAGLARLGMLISNYRHTEFPDILDRHVEERRDLEIENALSVEVERTVRVVLCTGGPHCEIRWDENRSKPDLICYGWFGAGEYRRTLTDEEFDGFVNAYGDFEDIVQYHEL